MVRKEEPKIGRPLKIAKSSFIDTGYQNELGLGVIGGEVDSPVDIKTISCLFTIGNTVDQRGWIVRQKGSRKFLVSNGIVTGPCSLVNKTSGLLDGEMSITCTTAKSSKICLFKFNGTTGVDFTGQTYFLSFSSASAIFPDGSLHEIIQVEST